MEQSQGTVLIAGGDPEIDVDTAAVQAAKVLGREIARSNRVLLVGCQVGFPLWTARGAYDEGGIVIGISPAADRSEHERVYRLPATYYTSIIFSGFGIMGRDMLLARSCDHCVVGPGELDTLALLSLCRSYQKPIGVLDGPWQFDEIARTFDVEQTFIYESNPAYLLEKLFQY